MSVGIASLIGSFFGVLNANSVLLFVALGIVEESTKGEKRKGKKR